MAVTKGPYDQRHADMVRDYIRVKEREGYSLFGVEVPYRRGMGHGYIDVVLFRNAGADQRFWVAAEMKTALADIGGAIRQVEAAREFFPSHHRRQVTGDRHGAMSFPLVVLASDQNLQDCVRYAKLLEKVQLEFFHSSPSVADIIGARFEIALAIGVAQGEMVGKPPR